jgi:hypothetical protein
VAVAAVSERELAALRAWLRDDLGGMSWQAVIVAVTRPRSKGFSKLTYATFSLATARLLSPTYTRSDVVRFVVKARTDHRRLTGDFDPLLASI